MTQLPPPGDPADGRTHRPSAMPPTEPAAPRPPVPSSQAPPPHRPPADEERAAAEAPAVRRSRFGGLWVGIIIAAVILVLLLIFVLQNSQTVQVDYFGLSGHLPLAVAILLGVAAGALLVAVPGTIRILQLRKAARR